MRLPGSSADDAGAVGRGTALVAAAVLLGIVVLQATDDEKQPFTRPQSSRTSTTVQAGDSSKDGGDSATKQKAEAKVLVLNASGRAGEGARLTERLRSRDFTMLAPGNADKQTTTKVFWKEGFEVDAATVGGAINDSGTSPPLERLPVPSPYKEGDADIVIVIGTQTG